MQKRSWLLERSAKYILAAVFVIVPLFPKFPLFSVTGTYVSVRFEDLILLLLSLLVAIGFLKDLKNNIKSRLYQSIGIFFLIGGLSLFSGVFLTQTAPIKIGLLHLFRRLEYLVPLFAVLTLLDPKKVKEYLSFYLKIILLVVTVAFLYGFGQRYWNFPIIITQNEEYSKGVALFWTPGGHINSTFAGHYDAAAVMVLMLPILIPLFVASKDKITKLLLALTSSFGLWLLINSLSRIAQLSYLVALGLAFLFAKRLKALVFFILVSTILVGSSSGLAVRFGRIFEVYYGRIVNSKPITFVQSKFVVFAEDSVLPARRESPVATPTPIPVFEDRSTSIRFNVEWPRAIRAFNKNIIFGTGYSSINLATDNDYLRLLGETGIFGFIAFFFIFSDIFKEVISFFRNSEKYDSLQKTFIYGVVGGICGTFVNAFFLDIFEASKFAIIFWMLVGLMLLVIRSENVEKNN